MSPISRLRSMVLPLVAIDKCLPEKGRVYEVGCGYGSLCFEIEKLGQKRSVIGLDNNHSKLMRAKRDFEKNNICFELADATRYRFKKCDGVVLSDFLHHLSFGQHRPLIKKLFAALNSGGVLVIKEIDKDDGIRMWASRLWDYLLYPRDAIYYRSTKQWIEILKNEGFDPVVNREVLWFPGSTFVYKCTKQS